MDSRHTLRRMGLAMALALLVLPASRARAGQTAMRDVAHAVTGAASQKELADQMRAWIVKKGRHPTERELREKGGEFRRAWNAYKHLHGRSLPKPSADEYRQAAKMRDWIKAHGRDPNSKERNRDSEMRRAWGAYQKVLRYKRQERELDDRKRQLQREEQAKRDYGEAVEAVKLKRYAAAFAQLKKLHGSKYAKALQEGIKARLAEINEAGNAELAKVKPLVDERKYREAIEAYGKVATLFAGSPTEKAAKDARTKLQLDPAVIRELRLQRAQVLWEKANAAYATKDYLDALTFYEELATKFTDVPEVKEASPKLATMRADKAIMAKVAVARLQRDVKTQNAHANSFERNGLIDKAIDALQVLVAKYPGTEAAAAAKAHIDRLEKRR